MTHVSVEVDKGHTVVADINRFAADLLMSGGMDYSLVSGTREMPSTIKVAGDVGPTLVHQLVEEPVTVVTPRLSAEA